MFAIDGADSALRVRSEPWLATLMLMGCQRPFSRVFLLKFGSPFTGRMFNYTHPKNHTLEWTAGSSMHEQLEYIAQEAYFQITSNPVYSATFASLALVAVAWAKARCQKFVADLLLTQVQLPKEASEKLRKYAAFQLQDSAKCTRVELGGMVCMCVYFATIRAAHTSGAATCKRRADVRQLECAMYHAVREKGG